MTTTISQELLDRLSQLLSDATGLWFPRERHTDLVRGITGVARDLKHNNLADCVQCLLSKPLPASHLEVLASHFTVGETYFFRDYPTFEVIRDQVLRPLIDSRQSHYRCLRLWSAACSTGEEAYSLAILLDRLMPNQDQWQISITGTDINPLSLQRARAGVYGEWSFRNAPPWLKADYFTVTEERKYQLIERIRRRVEFQSLNLIDPAYPASLQNTNAMDVILCRNVLMYFNETTRHHVIRQLAANLQEQGWFAVSPSEHSLVSPSMWVAKSFPEVTTFYQKRDANSALPLPVPSIFNVPELSDEKLFLPVKFTEPPAWLIEPVEDIHSPPVRDPLPERKAVKEVITPYERARRLYAAGDYQEAEAILSRSDDRELLSAGAPASPEATWLLRAKISANLGKLVEAEQWCVKIISKNKLSPEAHYLLASILLEQNKLSDALAALNKTIYLEPDHLPAYIWRGNLSRRLGKGHHARRDYKIALSLLETRAPQDILPEMDGMTAGQLAKMLTENLTASKSPELDNL